VRDRDFFGVNDWWALEYPVLASRIPWSRIMVDFPSIDELIRRIRAGDQEAAAVLVKRYEPAIRRAVRIRLADARLGALLDTTDICQSVLGSFFIRVATGQYKLETPGQLFKLLTTMARNKLISQARRQHAQRRDTRRITSRDQDDEQFVSARQSPSNQVAVRDLLQEVQRRLSPEERRMLELKNEGQDWASIASQLGGSAEALRRRLSRALDRVAEELGLDHAS
jgi:RNA polymerase sigma-70 factor (ECF subfamily)